MHEQSSNSSEIAQHTQGRPPARSTPPPPFTKPLPNPRSPCTRDARDPSKQLVFLQPRATRPGRGSMLLFKTKCRPSVRGGDAALQRNYGNPLPTSQATLRRPPVYLTMKQRS
ncbi:hypothetical protein C0Q70_15604 [Pomacea canaliculata]|uniref:Uncharacterized protein n=1 Tax=Pomacea canaliculata TaxID=400727 RepID=A0A2T7NVD4_POMCA|nr:hypothetical protein C0Q70_15604 [Pomacea canaliculata]